MPPPGHDESSLAGRIDGEEKERKKERKKIKGREKKEPTDISDLIENTARRRGAAGSRHFRELGVLGYGISLKLQFPRCGLSMEFYLHEYGSLLLSKPFYLRSPVTPRYF